MHRCQQFLFARCLSKSGHYQPSVFVAEAAVTQINITGKKSPRKRFIFFKDWHMFLKIIQDSLSKHFAAVTEQYQCCCCTDKVRQCAGLSFIRMQTLHVRGELARKLLFPEARGACRAWVVCRAGVRWLPAQCLWWVGCGLAGTEQDGMSPSSSLSTTLCFTKTHPRQY